MTSFPTAYGRAPQLLVSQRSLSLLERTNRELFQASQQLATGLKITRPSQDAVAAATIGLLDARLERSDQILGNLSMASGALDTIDNALGGALDLVNEAKGIALAQVGSLSTAEERENQAVVVDSLIASLQRIALTESAVGYAFGGSSPGTAPISEIGGSYRFMGTRGGLFTDLGSARTIPVTLGAQNAIGSLSNRIEGTVDLDPDLTTDTKLEDLNGGRGLGISKGVFRFSFNGDTPVDVDISDADTIGDVIDTISAAIADYETSSGNTVLDVGGISVSGGSIDIDVAAGGSLEFVDLQGGVTAQDLGLAVSPATPFTLANSAGVDLAPRLSLTTPVSARSGLGGTPLTSVRLNNNGQSVVVQLSAATNLGDIKAAFEAGDTGVRLEINDDGTGFNLVTEIAGGRERSLSIEEIDDGTLTATMLGIRSFARDTRIDDLNEGRGISILHGQVDPVTGLADPALDVDFTITLGDGFEIDIDLQPADIDTIGSVIDAINTQANAALTAAGRPTTDFVAELSNDTNGLVLRQGAGVGGSISVDNQNRSSAARDLGLLDATVDPSGEFLIGEDVGKVRVDNLFTHLIDLAEALRNNDTFGIELAGEKFDESIDRLSQTRGLVGGYAQRIDDETQREEERQLMDTAVRSQFRDLDYAEAATRFSLLQTQLQAGLTATAQLQQQSLLDFLG